MSSNRPHPFAGPRLPKVPSSALAQLKLPQPVAAAIASRDAARAAPGRALAPPAFRPAAAVPKAAAVAPRVPVPLQAKAIPGALVVHGGVPRVLQRARFKHLEGQSAGTALRITGAGVTASGTLTLADGTSVTKTGKNGDANSNLGTLANKRWEQNHKEVKAENDKGKKVPYPDNDAEASVLQQLRDAIVADGLKTNGGELSLTANGTAICKYCRRLIRAFCTHYNLTWTDDPKG